MPKHGRSVSTGPVSGRWEWPVDVAEVHRLRSRTPVLEIAAQGELDTRKSDLVPGDPGLVVQFDLQAFGTCASASSSDSRAAAPCSVSPFSMNPAGVVQ